MKYFDDEKPRFTVYYNMSQTNLDACGRLETMY